MKKLIHFLALCLFTISCNDTELEITREEKNIILEAYLKNGEIPRFLIHESSHLNEKLSLLLLWRGKGKIITNYDTIKILNLLSPNFDKQQVFNYLGEKELHNLSLGDSIYFEMEFPDGRKISSKTSFVPKLQIQSVQDEQSHLSINLNTKHIKEYPYLFAKATSILPDTTFQTTSHYEVYINNSNYLGISLKLERPKKIGDSLNVELFRITKDYYDFLSQIKQSKKAKEGPEESPDIIQGNVENGIGIFTFIEKDQVTVYF